MGFKLKHIRSGEEKDFSTKEILELLGDKINDEIVLGKGVFRISSFVATDGSDFTPPTFEWMNQAFVVATKGTTTFPFVATSETKGLFFSVNGTLYQYGTSRDFHVALGSLIWHGAFDLEPTDSVIVKWLKIT
jgi:hypothetical protein